MQRQSQRQEAVDTSILVIFPIGFSMVTSTLILLKL
jgi:hypothetical protein